MVLLSWTSAENEDHAKTHSNLILGQGIGTCSTSHKLNNEDTPKLVNCITTRKSNISYDIAAELHKIDRLLLGKLKSAFEIIVNGLPSEVLGEEGPTGPKVKDYWNGDER
ncbi:hypothetical protein Scep_014602 [Stephania cephalantha]|uniref:Uncharacterized protein n=1 Tax=Stephania cephalantha TaxID=152367 RepID=A0AAP0P369_9MAGN